MTECPYIGYIHRSRISGPDGYQTRWTEKLIVWNVLGDKALVSIEPSDKIEIIRTSSISPFQTSTHENS